MIDSETNDRSGENCLNLKVSIIVVSTLMTAVGFNLVFLYPELQGGTLPLNDSVYHLLLAGSAVEALANGKDITDPWQRTMSLGHPIFHYYQHLPHISVALVHFITLENVSVFAILRWTTYLLLSIFPLSIYWSLRRFDFNQIIAAMGGLVAPLIGADFIGLGFSGLSDGVFKSWGGFGHSSYIFKGWGLYSQLWAMVLLPPALAMSFRVLTQGKGYFWAVSLLAATLMAHLLYGYMAFLTLGILTFIGVIGISTPKPFAGVMLVQWRRLITLFLLVVIVTSYFLVPAFLDRNYFNTGVFTAPVITDSLGHWTVLDMFISGDLFDWGRFPSFTILVSVGIGICVIRWPEKRYMIPVAIFFLWLLLFFGRPTWGFLIEILPMSQYLHMHRFIGGVHLGGILLAAIALGSIWGWAIARAGFWPIAISIAVTLMLLSPLYIERHSYLTQNSLRINQSKDDLSAEYSDLISLVETVKNLPPGRVYAGTVRDVGGWGGMYRINCPEKRSDCIHVYKLLQTEGLDVMSNGYHVYSLSSDTIFNFDETRWEHYNLFNVRYVVAPENQWVPDFVVPLNQFGRHTLYEVETTGYFDLVGSDLDFAGHKEDFYAAASSWLLSNLPKTKDHPKVLVSSTASEIGLSIPLSKAPKIIANTQTSAGILRGEVLSEEVGSNYFRADVDILQKSILLLKTSYHPNWRATVDGVEVDTIMVMPGFTGVQLRPGKHEIHMEYLPRSIRKILLGLGFLTLLMVPIIENKYVVLSAWFTKHVLPKHLT